MSTLSPSMSLVIPTSGVTTGPQYALDINTSLSLIDLHDHTPGKGVQITTAGLNINSTLSLNNNLLTNSAGLTFLSQGSTPAVRTIYNSDSDLYFVDGVGNNIRITQSGGIAGSPGSIANLTSPASASYVSLNNTFVWQSNVNTAANMDVGSILIREVAASANAITIASPTGLSSNFQLTLPAALPLSQKFLALDATGNITAPYSVDNSTIEISSNVIQVKAGGITTTQLAANAVETINIKDADVTNAKLRDSAVTSIKIAVGTILDVNVNNNANISRRKIGTAISSKALIPNLTVVPGTQLLSGTFVFPQPSGTSPGVYGYIGVVPFNTDFLGTMVGNAVGSVFIALTVNGVLWFRYAFTVPLAGSYIPIGAINIPRTIFPVGSATIALTLEAGSTTSITCSNIALYAQQG